MKKILLLAAILMLTLAFSACSEKDEPDVVATNPVVEQNEPTEPVEPAETVEPTEPEEPVVEEEEEPGVPGIRAGFMRDGSSGSGLDIFIGSTADVWPYADGETDEDGNWNGLRAFEPIPDRTYRIVYTIINQTSESPFDEFTGASGFRVRWTRDADYGNYTDGDTEIVNDYEISHDEVATIIPVLFNNDSIEKGETYNLVVEITLDGAEEYDGLTGNIVLRGLYGVNEWYASALTIELLEEGPGSAVEELLVNWTRE